MWKRNFRDARTGRPGRRRTSRRVGPGELARLELLDRRVMPAVTATFSAATGVLTVLGDAQNNNIGVSRNAAGSIFVNGGAIRIRGARPTVANTRLIQVFGQNGNDVVSLNEAAGVLPKANLFGGNGNDKLAGGSNNDQLSGDAGNDTLLGKGGVDKLLGGNDNDVLTGGTGNDQVFGQAGDDRMIWNQGDGSDLNEGGTGNDTVEVNGGNGDETFAISANGTRVKLERTTAVAFTLDIGTSEHLALSANGGNDTITAGDGLAALIQIAVDAGAGNDTVQGGDGVDTLIGGDGDDFIDGGKGNDAVFLGAGDDTFRWDPGDGNDTVEGQAGSDTLLFNGANVAENVDISANGTRVKFFRDVANVTIDLDDTEAITFNALGGADTISVDDTTGTDLAQVNLNLGATGGGGDGSADSVSVSGTGGDDNIQVATANGNGIAVTGLPARVDVTGSEGANDHLTVNAQAGNDTVNALNLFGNLVGLIENGGAGSDNMLGSQGNDLVIGGTGNDAANMSAGDDTFRWDPGDGSDQVQGALGDDTLLFNGSNADEQIDVSADGGHVTFFRNVGNVTIQLNDVEGIDFNALAGADKVTVNDLTGTDLTRLDLDLATPPGSGTGDGAADSVIINGTDEADAISVAGDADGVAVSGLQARVNIEGAEAADRLTINALGGDDVVDAAGLSAGALPLTENGGNGNDILIGGAGDDTLNGEAGDDVLFGRGGLDTLDGGTGTNTLIQD